MIQSPIRTQQTNDLSPGFEPIYTDPSLPNDDIENVANYSNYLYAATFSDNVKIYNIQNQLHPVYMNIITGFSYVLKVSVWQDYLIVVDRNNTISIYTLTNPYEPQLFNKVNFGLNTPYVTFPNWAGITETGILVLQYQIYDPVSDIILIDLRDMSNITTQVHNLQLRSNINELYGKYFINYQENTNGSSFIFYDVSNTQNPFVAYNFSTSDYSRPYFISNQLFYHYNGSAWSSYNISDFTISPAPLVNTFSGPKTAVANDDVAILSDVSSLSYLNISDPYNIQVINTTSISQYLSITAPFQRALLLGTTLFVPQNGLGIDIYELTNGSITYNYFRIKNYWLHKTMILDDTVFIFAKDYSILKETLIRYKINRNDYSLTLQDNVTIGSLTRDVKLIGEWLYFGNVSGMYKLSSITFTEANITQIYNHNEVDEIYAMDKYIIAVGVGNVTVISASNNTVFDSVLIPSSHWYGEISNHSNTVYVPYPASDNFVGVDIADPTNITLVYQNQDPYMNAYEISMYKDYMYILGSGRVNVYQFGINGTPEFVNEFFPPPGNGYYTYDNMLIINDTLYIAGEGSGLFKMDLAGNPSNPVFKGAYIHGRTFYVSYIEKDKFLVMEDYHTLEVVKEVEAFVLTTSQSTTSTTRDSSSTSQDSTSLVSDIPTQSNQEPISSISTDQPRLSWAIMVPMMMTLYVSIIFKRKKYGSNN